MPAWAAQTLPNDTGWYGRWRLAANASNDYMIDRGLQRTGSYSGIDGIHLQDQAMTESMGSIVDHTLEHLAVSDLMIARTRRRIIQAARAVAEGIAPPGVDTSRNLSRRARRRLPRLDLDRLARSLFERDARSRSNPTGALRIAAE